MSETREFSVGMMINRAGARVSVNADNFVPVVDGYVWAATFAAMYESAQRVSDVERKKVEIYEPRKFRRVDGHWLTKSRQVDELRSCKDWWFDVRCARVNEQLLSHAPDHVAEACSMRERLITTAKQRNQHFDNQREVEQRVRVAIGANPRLAAAMPVETRIAECRSLHFDDCRRWRVDFVRESVSVRVLADSNGSGVVSYEYQNTANDWLYKMRVVGTGDNASAERLLARAATCLGANVGEIHRRLLVDRQRYEMRL